MALPAARSPRPSSTDAATAAARQILMQLDERSRSAIVRYYSGEDPRALCAELGLSLAQFAAVKQRVRRAFWEALPLMDFIASRIASM